MSQGTIDVPGMNAPPFLIFLYLLSATPINVSVLFPVDASPFLIMLHLVNAFVCCWKGISIAGIVGVVLCL